MTATVRQDELSALRDSARGYLETVVRRDVPPENDAEKLWWWADLAALGWLGLLVPTEHDGSDAGATAAAVVVEELAYAGTTTPYLASAVLATRLLSDATGVESVGQWLADMAVGEITVAAVLTGPSGIAHRAALGLRATSVAGNRVVVDGIAGYVADARSAELLVAAATDAAGEVVIIAIDSSAPGVTVEPVSTHDNGHRLAHVRFDAVACEPAAVLAHGPYAAALYEATLRLATLMLAADSLGVARRAFELALDYAKQRRQFGRAIGSFQAIKHKLADMYVLLTASSALVEQAAAAIDDPELGARRVAAAGTYVREAAARIAGDAMQIHGANGYTWEHPCHRLLKRTKFNERYLTTLWSERDTLAGLVLEPPAARSGVNAR